MVEAEVYGIKMRLFPGDNLGDRYVLFTPFYLEKVEREYLPRRLPLRLSSSVRRTQTANLSPCPARAIAKRCLVGRGMTA